MRLGSYTDLTSYDYDVASTNVPLGAPKALEEKTNVPARFPDELSGKFTED